MNRWKQIFYLTIFVASLSSAPRQVNADEIFYCYSEVDSTLYNPSELNIDFARPYKGPGMEVFTLNLTKKQIGYNDDGVLWLDAESVKTERDQWIITSPMVQLSEGPPAIFTIYFNRAKNYFSFIWRGFSEGTMPELWMGSGRCKTKRGISNAALHASAQDIFYCYQNFRAILDRKQKVNGEFRYEDIKLRSDDLSQYDFAINFTHRRVGYYDPYDPSSDSASGARWLYPKEQPEGDRWVMNLPMFDTYVWTQGIKGITTIYFDRKNLHYTKIWQSPLDKSDQYKNIALERVPVLLVSSGQCRARNLE